LKRARDFAEVRGEGAITEELAGDALRMLDIDELGLDDIDRRILRAIVEKFAGGPVGIETLAAAISEETDTVMDVYEPFLIQLGFLQRTPGGVAGRLRPPGSTLKSPCDRPPVCEQALSMSPGISRASLLLSDWLRAHPPDRAGAREQDGARPVLDRRPERYIVSHREDWDGWRPGTSWTRTIAVIPARLRGRSLVGALSGPPAAKQRCLEAGAAGKRQPGCRSNCRAPTSSGAGHCGVQPTSPGEITLRFATTRTTTSIYGEPPLPLHPVYLADDARYQTVSRAAGPAAARPRVALHPWRWQPRRAGVDWWR
jgi:hypothetical protein